MKNPPFPAWHVRMRETGVSFLRVQVEELFPETRVAYVSYGRGLSGRMQVPYAELASTVGTAVKLAAAALVKLENPLPASNEKSAVVSPLAGGEAGESLP